MRYSERGDHLKMASVGRTSCTSKTCCHVGKAMASVWEVVGGAENLCLLNRSIFLCTGNSLQKTTGLLQSWGPKGEDGHLDFTTGWWFQHFFLIFLPIPWGDDPI